MRRRILQAARLAGMASIAVAVPHALPAQQVKAGGQAPDVVLPDLHGDTVRLSALRGRPVVLKFWAKYCPSCRTELPDVAMLVRTSGDRLAVVTVDSDDRPSAIVSYLHGQGLDSAFTVLIDHARRMQERYQIFGLPTTYFIDSTGTIRMVHQGPLTTAQLQSGVDLIVPHHTQE